MSYYNFHELADLHKAILVRPEALAVRNAISAAAQGVGVSATVASAYAKQYSVVKDKQVSPSTGEVTDVTPLAQQSVPRYEVAEARRSLAQTQANIDSYLQNIPTQVEVTATKHFIGLHTRSMDPVLRYKAQGQSDWIMLGGGLKFGQAHLSNGVASVHVTPNLTGSDRPNMFYSRTAQIGDNFTQGSDYATFGYITDSAVDYYSLDRWVAKLGEVSVTTHAGGVSANFWLVLTPHDNGNHGVNGIDQCIVVVVDNGTARRYFVSNGGTASAIWSIEDAETYVIVNSDATAITLSNGSYEESEIVPEASMSEAAQVFKVGYWGASPIDHPLMGLVDAQHPGAVLRDTAVAISSANIYGRFDRDTRPTDRLLQDETYTSTDLRGVIQDLLPDFQPLIDECDLLLSN